MHAMPDLVAAAALSASGGQVRVVVQCGSFESTGPCSDANLIYSLLRMQDAMRLGGDNSAPTMRPGLVSCSPTSRGRFLVNGALGTPPSWWHRSGRRIPPLAPCRPGPPVRVHGFGLASCRRGGHGKAPAHGRGFGRGDAAAGAKRRGRRPCAGARRGPGGTGRARRYGAGAGHGRAPGAYAGRPRRRQGRGRGSGPVWQIQPRPAECGPRTWGMSGARGVHDGASAMLNDRHPPPVTGHPSPRRAAGASRDGRVLRLPQVAAHG